MDINYELYKIFYHVAVTLSFSEASKQLFTFQSTISQSIKVLEKKLNQPLFIRGTKKVQLTPEGEILLKRIEPIMNLIEKEENQLLGAHTLNGGQLRIGASSTICRYCLVPYLNRFHKEFPNIRIKITNQTSIECAKFLESGQADFIVTSHPNSVLASSMNTRVISEFHDMFVASRNAFLLRGSRISLEELLRYPTVMLGHKNTTSGFLYQVFQKNQLDLVPEIELSSSDLLIDLTHIGLGIAFIPDFCIPQSDKELFILDLKKQLLSRQMMAAHDESLPISQATRRFMDMLQKTDI